MGFASLVTADCADGHRGESNDQSCSLASVKAVKSQISQAKKVFRQQALLIRSWMIRALPSSSKSAGDSQDQQYSEEVAQMSGDAA